MVETALVSRLLGGDLVRAGQKLVTALEKAKFPFEAAFWMLIPDDTDWKLVIVSSDVTSSGLLKAYGRVLRRAPEHPGLYWPSTIRLEAPDEPRVQALLKSVRLLDRERRTGDLSVHQSSSAFEPVRLFIYKA